MERVGTVLENAVERENEAKRRKDEVHKRKVKADEEMHTAQSEQRKRKDEIEVSINCMHIYIASMFIIINCASLYIIILCQLIVRHCLGINVLLCSSFCTYNNNELTKINQCMVSNKYR